MSISNKALLAYLNQLLAPEKCKDYCPNGLQVEGKSEIKKLVTGVTASYALIEKAIEMKADAIFVHHGYFWRGENQQISGMKHKRIKALLTNDINLFAYHLPLDIHPTLGNNAQLAMQLDIQVEGSLEPQNPASVTMKGRLANPMTAQELTELVQRRLQRQPLLIEGGDHLVETVGWCTGGGQGFIENAADQELDAFISGEISEQTTHVAHEMNIHYIAAGHHATERYGAKAVGEHLAEKFSIDVTFVDIDNPV